MKKIDIHSNEFKKSINDSLPQLETLMLNKLGIGFSLYVEYNANRRYDFITLNSKDVLPLLGTLGAMMFKELEFSTWGGEIKEDTDIITFTPKMFFKIHSGGSNGCGLGQGWHIELNTSNFKWSIVGL